MSKDYYIDVFIMPSISIFSGLQKIVNKLNPVNSSRDPWKGRNREKREIPKNSPFYDANGRKSKVFDLTKRSFHGVCERIPLQMPGKQTSQMRIYREIPPTNLESPYIGNPHGKDESIVTLMPCSRKPADGTLLDLTMGIRIPTGIFPSYTDHHFYWLSERNYEDSDEMIKQWFDAFKEHCIRNHPTKILSFNNVGLLSGNFQEFQDTFCAFAKDELLPNHQYHSLSWYPDGLRLTYFIQCPVIDEFLKKKGYQFPKISTEKSVKAFAFVFEVPYMTYNNIAYLDQLGLLLDFQKRFSNDQTLQRQMQTQVLSQYIVNRRTNPIKDLYLPGRNVYNKSGYRFSIDSNLANSQNLTVTSTVSKTIMENINKRVFANFPSDRREMERLSPLDLTPNRWKKISRIKRLDGKEEEVKVKEFINNYCTSNVMLTSDLNLVTVYPIEKITNAYHSRTVSEDILYDEKRPTRVARPYQSNY